MEINISNIQVMQQRQDIIGLIKNRNFSFNQELVIKLIRTKDIENLTISELECFIDFFSNTTETFIFRFVDNFMTLGFEPSEHSTPPCSDDLNSNIQKIKYEDSDYPFVHSYALLKHSLFQNAITKFKDQAFKEAFKT